MKTQTIVNLRNSQGDIYSKTHNFNGKWKKESILKYFERRPWFNPAKIEVTYVTFEGFNHKVESLGNIL